MICFQEEEDNVSQEKEENAFQEEEDEEITGQGGLLLHIPLLLPASCAMTEDMCRGCVPSF